MKKLVQLAYGTIIVGVVVLLLKYLAYYLTGSVALYSDALESIVNVAAAIVLLFTLRLSTKPADDGHHFGHYKAEYFSSGFEGMFIIIAAVAIFHEAYNAYLTPNVIETPTLGLAINGIATIMNGVWGYHLVRSGRRSRSPALVADGKHLLSDVYSSFGIIIGVALSIISGWLWLDPLIAVIIGIQILWSGWKLLQESANGMMDAAPSKEELNKIMSVITDNYYGALEIHDLRVRHAGRAMFIDFHLVVPSLMSVMDSHDICDRIEHALKSEFEEVRISIHVEPEHKAKHLNKDSLLQ